METFVTSNQLQRHDTAPTVERQPAVPEVDDGLRSAGGIRWLHWIGALVIGVSVVGLLAARWGEMPRTVQFLVLVAGAVALQTAGDVARHRLRLAATGSALSFLFTALVPLLAWGAAYLGLVEESFGWLSLAVGLGALLWSVRQVLERMLEYRGAIYPTALGILLAALPLLSYVDDHTALDDRGFFMVAAIALGLVLRFASRHVNRFFFHRDRVAGVERPVHMLPFALLALVYTAGLSLLASWTAMFALPLAFLGVALIDTGEEYFRALVNVTSEVPERWPRRSVALLASGFALMAIAAAASPVDTTLKATALVTSIAALRLFGWALRYHRRAAYGFALASALVAYHFSPMLIPQGVKDAFWQLVQALGIRPGSSAVISLADLGALVGLVALGVVLQRMGRLTTPMLRLHAGFLTFQGLVVLGTAFPDPAAARTLVPLTTAVLVAGLAVLRRVELIPIVYLAIAHLTLVWVAPLLGAPRAIGLETLWTPEPAIAMGLLNLVGASAAYLASKRRPMVIARWATWSAGPLLAGAAITLIAALTWLPEAGIGAFLVTATTVTSLLAGWVTRASFLGDLARHEELWLGLVAVFSCFHSGAGGVALAGAVAAFELARGLSCEPSQRPYSGWTIQAWLGLAVIHAAVADWIDVGTRFAALALIAAAVAQSVLGEALERRGRPDLARPTRPVASVLAAVAGSLAIAGTISVSAASWWPILPGFLASLFFVFQARDGYLRVISSIAAMGFFAASLLVVFTHLTYLGTEVYWLAPGLALIGLARLLEREIGEKWSTWIFTAGAGCLYAMPVLGLLEEVTWGWQIVMLVLAIAFGAASFQLRSRSLLTLSTAAAVIDLGFFLLKLGRTAPLLLWAVGIVFGLSLMACATMLEYRRELLLQKIRVWGRELRSWA